MRAALFCFLAACGRIGFGGNPLTVDASDGPVSLDGPGDATVLVPTPSYLIELDENAGAPVLAGANGRVVVSEDFTGTTVIAGHAFIGKAMYVSGAVLWLDAHGGPTAGSVLDSTSICSVRELRGDGDRVLTIGYTQAGATTPADGPCALETSRQDAIAIAVDTAGAQTLVGRAASNAGNVQAWYATGFADGSIALAGVYATNGSIGSMPLPPTTSSEQPFYARIDPATGQARWLQVIASADLQFAGPVDARGDELCVTGGFPSGETVFGRGLTPVGGVDQWVARVDANGAARFVRGFGSAANEATTQHISVVATADGGCTVATTADGDVVVDGISLPVSAGGSILVHFDGTGTATSGARVPAGFVLDHIGDAIYAASPTSAGIQLVSVPDLTVLGEITGASLVRFATVPPAALAVTFVATPPVAFGALTLSSSGNALAVLAL